MGLRLPHAHALEARGSDLYTPTVSSTYRKHSVASYPVVLGSPGWSPGFVPPQNMGLGALGLAGLVGGVGFGVLAAFRRNSGLARRRSGRPVLYRRLVALVKDYSGDSKGDTLPNDQSLRNIVLVLVYVAMDMSVYFVAERASQDYRKQTLLLSSGLLSTAIGVALSYYFGGRSSCQECFNPKEVLRLLPVSAAFTISMICCLLSFRYFDGAFLKLSGQLKLPLTALLSAMVLSRRYSALQWQIILLICAGCTAFMSLKLGSVAVDSIPLTGLCCLFGWITVNSLASLLAERALKGRPGETKSFPVTVTHMRLGEVFTTIVLLQLQSDFVWSDFFASWDLSTLAVLATVCVDAWLSGLMVLQLSSVAKNVAKSTSFVVLYCTSLASGSQPLVLTHVLSALIIIQSTCLFAYVSWSETKPSQKLSE